MKLCEKTRKQAFIYWVRTTAFFVGLAFSSFNLLAQSCSISISNNVIEAKQALCLNTVVLLQGSIPEGGDGSYTYRWEVADGNCGESDFTPIDGATGKDYAVMSGAEPNRCYRRVVTSGDCVDKSNKIKVDDTLQTTPVPPTTAVVQPTCSTPTGTITVTSPEPAPGITYSIDGISYTNTTGVFTGLSPAVYKVSVQYDLGCISPVNEDTIEIMHSLTGTITPSTAVLCAGGIDTLKLSGGTSYQWYRDGVAIEGATTDTYLVKEAGTYTADITDGFCTGTAANNAVVTLNPSISFDLAITDLYCTNAGGKIAVTNPSGGSGSGFLYSKDGGASFQQDSLFSALDTGSYNIVVMDSTGCTSSSKVATVKQSSSTLKASTSVIDIGCDQSAGAVTVVATGGEPPYRYSLDGGDYQVSGTFGNLAVGQHTISVKDSAGCDFDLLFDVKQTGSKPNLVISNPPVLCPGSTQSLQDTAIVRGSDKDLVFTFWTDSSAMAAVTNPAAVTAGTYYIKATNKDGCSSIKPVVVTLHNQTPGRISASGPTTVCSDQTVTLTASSGTAYQWYRNDTAIAGATKAAFVTSLAGVYSVKINDGTCSVFASNTIQVAFRDCSLPDAEVFVPSGFTPNRNGANDVLRPLLYNIATLDYFKVYNRWGQLIFQTNVIGKGWDGTIKGVPQPTEAYTWILECSDSNGKKLKQSGRSLLLR